MMLQQTTVATVVPYWERFLARFPDVAALAAADEAEVLSLWSGLGYYRRARMLHAAARLLVDRQAGRLPADHAGWAALPGVGDYAAGAIASIGLGERVPALDANARRVLVRWCAADPVAAAGMG
ncbi:MAG: A/G-specific adenine glycosylase, partial [Krumholzibacteria bacterium]|nr:A/G-specific adenine glycosylase [Candidatus Krumholzibacteria bacterium]